MSESIDLERRHEFDVFTKRDVCIVRGENARLWDDRGNMYVDCIAGHGVASVGHANPDVAAALAGQAKTLITCSGIFYNDQRARLFERLASVAPEGLNRSFLCNSGAEAVEAALKFARFTTKKTEFVCAMRSFHGRTFGALSATHNPKYKEDFEPLVPGFHHVPYNDFDALLARVNEKTAAILLEPVQGEGGIHVGKKEYFERIRALCDERGILMVLDEIQSGFCRTGRWFACEHFGVKPDMMVVAKAIAGGVPMGAVLCSEKIQPPVGRHGTTFGANPLACAAANAAIDFMKRERLEEQAAAKGAYLMKKLNSIHSGLIREIRGLGLMIGIELKEKAKPFIQALTEKGVLTLPSGMTVIRLLPPLTIPTEDLDFVAQKLGEVLGDK
ncbi:MAG: acetylornithine/succinylornithine family transaminase [bacterium]|nr:acetylornithine/succinylornithine family transaminase [bacterium]